METLVKRHIRDKILELHPLYQYQFAYQSVKSTKIALHQVIIHVTGRSGKQGSCTWRCSRY